jgi:hypothetical protein
MDPKVSPTTIFQKSEENHHDKVNEKSQLSHI